MSNSWRMYARTQTRTHNDFFCLTTHQFDRFFLFIIRKTATFSPQLCSRHTLADYDCMLFLVKLTKLRWLNCIQIHRDTHIRDLMLDFMHIHLRQTIRLSYKRNWRSIITYSMSMCHAIRYISDSNRLFSIKSKFAYRFALDMLGKQVACKPFKKI